MKEEESYELRNEAEDGAPEGKLVKETLAEIEGVDYEAEELHIRVRNPENETETAKIKIGYGACPPEYRMAGKTFHLQQYETTKEGKKHNIYYGRNQTKEERKKEQELIKRWLPE